jgi:precorrin-2 dehydrogenase / sirohydrochlorin ferrochelatase
MSGNQLYPVFLRLDKLQLLVVGGGTVAEEKLRFLHKSSPNAQVTIIAEDLREDVLAIAKQLNAEVINRRFEPADILPFDIIIAATNLKDLNNVIWQAAKDNNKLINVADTPDLCDFYMGGIVTRGDLKIAISTNGKSPTLAKRIREFLEDILPESTDCLIQNMYTLRGQIKTSFEEKVNTLNKLTASLITR